MPSYRLLVGKSVMETIDTAVDAEAIQRSCICRWSFRAALRTSPAGGGSTVGTAGSPRLTVVLLLGAARSNVLRRREGRFRFRSVHAVPA